MLKKNKKIGLLGGIGPEATGEFYLALISKLQERKLIKSNQDFPQIIINSIPAPELIYKNISRKDLRPYITGLKELENFRVNLIAMICNTIYLYYEKLQEEVEVPIIDLRKEVRNYLINKNIKSITVLGSPQVVKMGLYNFKGIKSIDLNKKEVKVLAKAIFHFNKGFDKIKQKEIAYKIAKKYLNQSAQLIILGCTEIELMLKEKDIPKLDPTDLLIEAIINYLNP